MASANAGQSEQRAHNSEGADILDKVIEYNNTPKSSQAIPNQRHDNMTTIHKQKTSHNHPKTYSTCLMFILPNHADPGGHPGRRYPPHLSIHTYIVDIVLSFKSKIMCSELFAIWPKIRSKGRWCYTKCSSKPVHGNSLSWTNVSIAIMVWSRPTIVAIAPRDFSYCNRSRTLLWVPCGDVWTFGHSQIHVGIWDQALDSFRHLPFSLKMKAAAAPAPKAMKKAMKAKKAAKAWRRASESASTFACELAVRRNSVDQCR